MPSTDKATLRQTFLTQRKALLQQAQHEASIALCARIQALSVYQAAKHIAFYQSIGGEISLHPLWLLAESTGKTCYMPVMIPSSKTLLFLPATSKTPQKISTHDILEPDVSSTHAISIEDLDLMIVPLVAFNTEGTRLGRGAGYYDRTLQHKTPGCILGAAYEFQQEPSLIADPWDISLTGIATEKNTYWSTS